MSSHLKMMEQATSSAQPGFPSSVPRPSSLVTEQLHKPPLSQSCPLRNWSRSRTDPKSTIDADLPKLPRSSGHADSPPRCLRFPAQNLQAVLNTHPNHVSQVEGRGEPSYLGDLLCPRALTLALGALALPPSSRNSHTPSAALGPGL